MLLSASLPADPTPYLSLLTNFSHSAAQSSHLSFLPSGCFRSSLRSPSLFSRCCIAIGRCYSSLLPYDHWSPSLDGDHVFLFFHYCMYPYNVMYSTLSNYDYYKSPTKFHFLHWWYHSHKFWTSLRNFCPCQCGHLPHTNSLFERGSLPISSFDVPFFLSVVHIIYICIYIYIYYFVILFPPSFNQSISLLPNAFSARTDFIIIPTPFPSSLPLYHNLYFYLFNPIEVQKL